MSPLRQALVDYLAVRRALGYKLKKTEKLLGQYLTYLEDRGDQRVRTETALTWATLPTSAHPRWTYERLSVVRGFAAHLRALDPATEIPPANLLPRHRCRATPYLYSDEDVAALMTAAATLRTPHRVATYRTLIGLLVVTGMRIGEAIGLDRADFDSVNGLLIVRNAKFGKSRELPLHPSTVEAVRSYVQRADRPAAAARTPALLVSTRGTRLLLGHIESTFHQLVCQAGLKPRSPSCRPRLHDHRHSFAVRTVLEGYRDGGDPGARLPLLSTYLGHVEPRDTYWYLSAAPELLALAASRLERHLGGES
jgi:integrase